MSRPAAPTARPGPSKARPSAPHSRETGRATARRPATAPARARTGLSPRQDRTAAARPARHPGAPDTAPRFSGLEVPRVKAEGRGAEPPLPEANRPHPTALNGTSPQTHRTPTP